MCGSDAGATPTLASVLMIALWQYRTGTMAGTMAPAYFAEDFGECHRDTERAMKVMRYCVVL